MDFTDTNVEIVSKEVRPGQQAANGQASPRGAGAVDCRGIGTNLTQGFLAAWGWVATKPMEGQGEEQQGGDVGVEQGGS